MKYIKICLFFLIAALPAWSQQKSLKVSSPDHSLVFTLSVEKEQVLYTLSLNGVPVIDPSLLGLRIDGETLGQAVSLSLIKRETGDQSYPTRGGHSLAQNRFSGAVLQLNAAKPWSLEVKVFNDGLAFRYLVPRLGKSVVEADQTCFKIADGSTVWSQSSITTYEAEYREQQIGELTKGKINGPPLTFKLAGRAGYAAITEAGLTDFAGMSLIAMGDRVLKANLTGVSEQSGLITTPWRVLLAGKTLNQLYNSDVISNVSAPVDEKLFPKGLATSWIKPGKCVWSWLAENGPVSLENMKRFTDWAWELGFAYNLVNEGWAKWQQGDKDKWEMMKSLVDYSAAKGVKIWAWKAYPDRGGEPGIKDSVSRRAFFKKCKEIGIAGLKIDFFDTESQEVIRYYQAALKDAAEFQLMLDFHGANKPTGASRTWPNEMTREGILGLEAGALGPRHNLDVLFTRFLAGHADFTPLSFEPQFTKGTTLTHQVATVAAFTSPLMCLGVNPQKLLESKVKEMVQKIPVVWDQTVILPQSEIGELAVMARRSGKQWFLVVLNGEKAGSVKVSMDFLGIGTYQSEMLLDTEDPARVLQKSGSFSAKDSLQIDMSAGGGFIGRFNK